MSMLYLRTLYTLALMLALTVIAQIGNAAERAHTFAETSVLSEGKWVKVALDLSSAQSSSYSGSNNGSEGIFQVTYDQLRKMGFSKPEQVAVYGYGGHVLNESLDEVEYDDLPLAPYCHDSIHSRIVFLGHGMVKWLQDEKGKLTHRQNTYETQAFYFLSDRERGTLKVYHPDWNYKTEPHLQDTILPAMSLHELESTNIGQSGKEKYGESFLSSKTQRFNLGTFAAGDVTLRINAIAKANATTQFAIKVNGQDEGELSIGSTSGSYTFATEGWYERKLKLEAESDIEVTLTFQPGAAKVDLARLNYIEVLGIRSYENVEKEGYVQDFPSVKVIGEVKNQNLHALPYADMVIVTAPAYLSEANRLAEYRRSHDGLSVTVLTPEKIYNEFSSGGQDATAIRLLMKKMQPRYLLLMGKGHYDNQKIDRQYFLPTYETDYSLAETSSCVCDDYFGFIDDGEGGKTDSNGRYQISDETLDVGVGRLPVSNTLEAKAVVDKIIAYSDNKYQGDWKTRLCFLSDDDKPGDSFNAHIQHNEQLVKSLEAAGHKEYAMQKIYLPAYKQTSSASGTDYPDAKKEFQESLKQGVLLVNYAGHGNATTITNENLMTANMAKQLSMRYLPVWVTASCDVGRWDNDESSLGECLTLNQNGGAIAMFTTVRIVYAHQNLRLNQAIIDNLFDRNADGTRFRLGDVLKAAKRALGRDYNKLNFCLMGDPSLTMAYPEQTLAITAVNGKEVNPSSQDYELQALETVKMEGVVHKTGSATEIDSTFNGIVFATLYDALDTLVADKGYVQDDADPYVFTSRTRKAFSGRGEVTKGRFHFSFMVPQAISSGKKKGLATLYACSNDWAEAQGFFDQYTLSGGTEYIRTDTVGPEITQLFLNDMLFTEGAVVNATPYFYAEVKDESGFNTTGNGIGHDMVLTIKCISNPLLSVKQYNLNNYFSTYSGQFQKGSVRYSIPALKDGDYEASFIVWDVFNNATRRTFRFTVGKGKAPNAVAVQAYPSPAKRGESLTFRVLHNRPESETEMVLEVFNTMGRLVYEKEVKTNQAPLHFAKDQQHLTVANTSVLADESSLFMGNSSIVWTSPNLEPGFYVYHIVLTSNGSRKVSESRILFIE